MPRSIAAVAAPLLLLACAQTSQPPVVTAPSATASAPATAAAAPPPATSAGATGPTAPASDVPAQYRTCNTDADCVAVPRAGCCPHGWKEAIAVPQKDAYARDFACTRTPRPICPLFLVRDARVARCDGKAHLCEMVQP
jgi:hypothetical protein